MSGGDQGDEQQPQPEQPRASQRLTSAHAPLVPNGVSRETTLGGVQKTKFAPIITQRRAKKEEGGEATVDGKPREQLQSSSARLARDPSRGPRGSGSRGRGRGGAGLLGDRNRGAEQAVVSGPFSLGPAHMAATRSRQPTVTLSAPASSRGSGAGGAGSKAPRGFGATRRSHNNSPISYDDSNLADLERIMGLESLALGHEHTPVYIGTPSSGDKEKCADQAKIEAKTAEIIAGMSQLCLFQLPPRLPNLALPSSGEVEAKENGDGDGDKSGNEPKSNPRPGECWPEGIEGQFGKLLVHASGRVSLEIDGIRYNLEPGADFSDAALSHLSGCQTMVAVDPEYEQSFELGPIGATFVASPDINQFL